MKTEDKLYVRGPRNPIPTSYEWEATLAEIERRPFCDIRSRRLIFHGGEA